MRTLSATLTAAQKASVLPPVLTKIVLTQGANTYTYTLGRIISIDHREEPFSQKADILLNNSDGALTALDLKGYKGVISYGFTTSSGDEYSACAPLYVIPQSLQFSPGKLNMSLSLKGILDLMDDDKASTFWIPELTNTVEDILTGIVAATNPAFSHCTAYTLTIESRDALINVYTPKQSIRITEGMSRLAALRMALSYTKCMVLVKADGAIHLFVPRTGAL